MAEPFDVANWNYPLPFDAFMAHALYDPATGYYTQGLPKLGLTPQDGSDFATAPEMSPYFGRCVAHQVAQLLAHTGTHEIWEFGAGSGALAKQVLSTLLEAQLNQVSQTENAPQANPKAAVANNPPLRYHIVDLSGSLVARQQQTLAKFAPHVHWHTTLPDEMHGVVLGNELIDAMPVKLLHRVQGVWHERHVVKAAEQLGSDPNCLNGLEPMYSWHDQPTPLRPPCEIDGSHDYLTEIHPAAEGWVATLAQRLKRGAVLLLDYGFSETEYYHPQRSGGTLMCHQAHLADANPLLDVGRKDITAHVNFTGLALAAQNAGLDVLGFATQARFLLNCGLLELLEAAPLAERAMAQKLITEHEMGLLFKALLLGAPGFEAPERFVPLGFAQGDWTHRL